MFNNGVAAGYLVAEQTHHLNPTVAGLQRNQFVRFIYDDKGLIDLGAHPSAFVTLPVAEDPRRPAAPQLNLGAEVSGESIGVKVLRNGGIHNVIDKQHDHVSRGDRLIGRFIKMGDQIRWRRVNPAFIFCGDGVVAPFGVQLTTVINAELFRRGAASGCDSVKREARCQLRFVESFIG